MADYYKYQRKRRDLGKPCNFQDSEIKIAGYTVILIPNYVKRNPNHIDLDNIAVYSEHSVNTERVSTGDKVMCHKEGGWPTGIDPMEQQDQNKYRRGFEKDAAFAVAVKELCNTVEKCILQNNQIDLFEEYFLDEESEHQVENLSTKLILFNDQSQGVKRSVSEISWHPEGPIKAAVSYAISRFQQMPEGMLKSSFVWDLQNPNSTEFELETNSPIKNLMYNPKLSDQIGGGCYNGSVAVWDVKKGKQPVLTSPVEKSHHDPITHFQWLFSKTGSECVTTWWDTRKLNEGPIETLNVTEGSNPNDPLFGATVLEYNTEAGPTKFVIGTEMGFLMVANKKPKKNVEITTGYGLESGCHLGPVMSINRSPPNPKFFLTIGDWSAKIWVEDIKTPIMRTKYHGSYLTDGCWSPTRNGVFFLTRKDGWMDVWDYYYRQNEIAFSHKVIAIADQDGIVTLLELCDSLYQLQFREKDVMIEMFDRESRKEKNLEAIKKQQDLMKKVVPKDNKAAQQKWEQRKAELIAEAEQQFSQIVKKDEEVKLDQLDEFSPKGSKTKKDDKKQQPKDDDKQQDQQKGDDGQQQDKQDQQQGDG
ncbi:unnamed protein product [Paramecium sonneborni]|uniref:Dynein intermediate chain n=1 Tax=Paramecium sonneborni TaxID=65129 RepID=A0A8S1PYY0_9CILI|nr:unnamed protein product [Paramecium sonneborni]